MHDVSLLGKFLMMTQHYTSFDIPLLVISVLNRNTVFPYKSSVSSPASPTSNN